MSNVHDTIEACQSLSDTYYAQQREYDAAHWLEEAAATMGRQAAENERLRAALKPFVDAYERANRSGVYASAHLYADAWEPAAQALQKGDKK